MTKYITALALFLMSLCWLQNASAQITLQCVKPGEQLLVKPDNDTLWVMDNYRMIQVIETGRKFKLEKEKSGLLEQKCDTLREIINQKDELVSTIENDRQYYIDELKKSREATIAMGEQAKKYQRRARWATIGCGVAAGVGFVVGALLFK
ncbi:MAG: hypothetical protein IKR94_08000 [Bacteroidales bacterium]|nr:hypothetical protein [Bacteroidales bacterium]